MRRGIRIRNGAHLIRIFNAAIRGLDESNRTLNTIGISNSDVERMREVGVNNRLVVIKMTLVELLHLLKYAVLFKASTTLAVNAARQQNINKKKGDSMRNYIIDSRGRRIRVIDHRAYAIRHSDGLKEIAFKIREKAGSLVRQFKQMKGGQKIAYVLLKIIKLVAALFAVKTAVDIKRRFAEIKREKNELINLSEEWQRSGIEANAQEQRKAVALGSGVKVVIALVSALLAASGEKVVAAGLPSDYTEENYPEG